MYMCVKANNKNNITILFICENIFFFCKIVLKALEIRKASYRVYFGQIIIVIKLFKKLLLLKVLQQETESLLCSLGLKK